MALRQQLSVHRRPAQSIDELRLRARRRLPRMVFDFIDGGAGSESTLRSNLTALARLTLQQRVLVDVRERQITTSVAGERLDTPLILAPTGGSRMAGRDGEIAAARAAESRGTVSVLSTGSTISLEEVAASVKRPQWFQLYPWGSDDMIDTLLGRAVDAGYRVLVITVDSPVGGVRERDVRNGLTVPPRIDPRTGRDVLMHPRWVIELLTGPKITFANLIGLVPGTGSGASSLAATLGGLLNPGHTWADIERIRSRWPGPTFVKGVMCAADAQRAVDAGCDGVIVSNHGGRQADGVAASIDVLPEVVAAIGDSGEVLFDGGVRRGGDIIKALALGARACLIGRPWLYGLGAEGLPGVERAIDILTAELDSTLALIGCASVADLSPSAIRRP